MKLGLHVSQISAMLPSISVYQCKKMVSNVRELLSDYFVPIYLGLRSTSRAEVIKGHTSVFARTLLNADADQAFMIWDGTYIYIQKSCSYSFQHKTYSGHKNRNLAKFMMLISNDGLIVETVGPYLADGKNNDAKIMEDMFKANLNDIENYFERKDIFIVDRGFRDCLEFLTRSKILYQECPVIYQEARSNTQI